MRTFRLGPEEGWYCSGGSFVRFAGSAFGFEGGARESSYTVTLRTGAGGDLLVIREYAHRSTTFGSGKIERSLTTSQFPRIQVTPE